MEGNNAKVISFSHGSHHKKNYKINKYNFLYLVDKGFFG